MRLYVISSLIAHLMILMIIVLDLPFFARKTLPEPVQIGVEVITHLPEKKQEIKEPDPAPTPEKNQEVEEKPAPAKVPDETIVGAKEDLIVDKKLPDAPLPQEKVEKIPDALAPKIIKKPEVKPEAKEAAKPKVAQIKPKQKPKLDPKVQDEFDQLADALLKEETPKPPKKADGAGGGQKGPKGLEAGDRERISKQLQPCWVMQEVADVNVEISVKMGPDGRFTNPKVKDSLFGGSAINRSIGEAAQRAILDERCNDFSWLKEKFSDLTSLTLIFNPRDMVGW